MKKLTIDEMKEIHAALEEKTCGPGEICMDGTCLKHIYDDVYEIKGFCDWMS